MHGTTIKFGVQELNSNGIDRHSHRDKECGSAREIRTPQSVYPPNWRSRCRIPGDLKHRGIERGDDCCCLNSPSGRRCQRRVRAHVPSAAAATSRSDRTWIDHRLRGPSRLKPDIFFLLFLPPLLFLDGWRIPKEGLFRDKGTILELGLVVFTVVGVGFFMNLMIPEMPVAIAFALAAIVSPTDPIAVSAIAARERSPSL